MIYKPYNVYPHNSSIDATERNTFSFIFSGDSLTYMDYHFYDTADNSLVRRAYVPLKFQNTFNDYNVGTIMGANSFKNGHKYKYKMNLYQARADIFAVQGTVRSIPEASLSDTQIPISYGITEIESPIKYTIDGVETIVGACYMEINDGTNREIRRIENYNPELKYGTDDGYGNYDYRTYVTLASPFSVKPTAGTTYKIFKNYITTPEYYFECYKKPVIIPTAELGLYGNIECSAFYSQAQGVSVKNYQYKLYKSVEDKIRLETTVSDNENTTNKRVYIGAVENSNQVGYNCYATIYYTDTENNYTVSETRIISNYHLTADNTGNYIEVSEEYSFIPTAGMNVKIWNGTSQLVAESPVIFNQSLEYAFNNIIRDVGYKVILSVTTQSNFSTDNEITGTFKSINTDDGSIQFSGYIDNNTNDIRIVHNKNVDSVLIEREDLETNEITNIDFRYVPIHDYLVASNKKYRYNLIEFAKNTDTITYGSKYTIDVITPSWHNWIIYSLIPWKGSGRTSTKETFRVTESWKFCINAEESEIVQNLNHYTHTGYSSKPKITINNNNYISGSLSCIISDINPTDAKITDSIYKVQAWNKFISENELFVLKNPKGDVWVISVTDNPTRKYDYSNRIMQTTINFSFTECMDINDIAIVN